MRENPGLPTKVKRDNWVASVWLCPPLHVDEWRIHLNLLHRLLLVVTTFVLLLLTSAGCSRKKESSPEEIEAARQEHISNAQREINDSRSSSP